MKLKSQDKQPKNVPIPPNTSGYPENVPNSQTVPTRGKGAATKGYSSSKKLG